VELGGLGADDLVRLARRERLEGGPAELHAQQARVDGAPGDGEAAGGAAGGQVGALVEPLEDLAEGLGGARLARDVALGALEDLEEQLDDAGELLRGGGVLELEEGDARQDGPGGASQEDVCVEPLCLVREPLSLLLERLPLDGEVPQEVDGHLAGSVCR